MSCNAWSRSFTCCFTILKVNVLKPLQKWVKNSELNLDFLIIHSIVTALVETFLKRQISITIHFFVTRNVPTTCEKFVNISISFIPEARLRSYFKNSCFHQFSRVWKPLWNTRTRFEIEHHLVQESDCSVN